MIRRLIVKVEIKTNSRLTNPIKFLPRKTAIKENKLVLEENNPTSAVSNRFN